MLSWQAKSIKNNIKTKTTLTQHEQHNTKKVKPSLQPIQTLPLSRRFLRRRLRPRVADARLQNDNAVLLLRSSSTLSPSNHRQAKQPGSQTRMSGRNYGICHSCRAKDHLFAECKKKRPCTRCNQGFEKCFVVEKENKNKGKLFLCCSRNCGFWEWVVQDASSGQSSHGTTTFDEPVVNDTDDEISHVFKSRVRISDEEELQISVNVSIKTEKIMAEMNTKGKRPI